MAPCRNGHSVRATSSYFFPFYLLLDSYRFYMKLGWTDADSPTDVDAVLYSSHNRIIPCTVGGKTVATRVRASTSIHPYLFNITDAPTHPAIALLLLMIIIEPINDFVFISNGFFNRHFFFKLITIKVDVGLIVVGSQ